MRDIAQTAAFLVNIAEKYPVSAVIRMTELWGEANAFGMNCMTEPDIVHALLEKITSFLIAYVLEYKKAGASGIILAEPSIAMISPDMAEDLSHRYLERIISDSRFCVTVTQWTGKN